MMVQIIDRKQLKAETKDLLSTAQISPKAMTALYLAIAAAISLLATVSGGSLWEGGGVIGTFVSVLTTLLSEVLAVGFVLYCMAIRRSERAEALTLFDGFSFAGKIIALYIVQLVFVFLWSLLLILPGFIAAYRYSFAYYNLCENPGIGVMEALDMSKRQTEGYKSQLFMLSMSYWGWGFLASIPHSLYTLAVESSLGYDYFGNLLPAPAWAASLLSVSPIVWSLIISLWALVVSLFYLPNLQCVELGYFEIAKRTSGIGAGVQPPENADPWADHRGPDDLGGYPPL